MFAGASTTTEPILNNLVNPIKILDKEAKDSQKLIIIEDFDIFGLNLIKVPKKVDFPFSFASNYHMDPYKKV